MTMMYIVSCQNIPLSTKVTVPNLGVRRMVCLMPPAPTLVSSNLFKVPLYWSLAAVLKYDQVLLPSCYLLISIALVSVK